MRYPIAAFLIIAMGMHTGSCRHNTTAWPDIRYFGRIVYSARMMTAGVHTIDLSNLTTGLSLVKSSGEGVDAAARLMVKQ